MHGISIIFPVLTGLLYGSYFDKDNGINRGEYQGDIYLMLIINYNLQAIYRVTLKMSAVIITVSSYHT